MFVLPFSLGLAFLLYLCPARGGSRLLASSVLSSLCGDTCNASKGYMGSSLGNIGSQSILTSYGQCTFLAQPVATHCWRCKQALGSLSLYLPKYMLEQKYTMYFTCNAACALADGFLCLVGGSWIPRLSSESSLSSSGCTSLLGWKSSACPSEAELSSNAGMSCKTLKPCRVSITPRPIAFMQCANTAKVVVQSRPVSDRCIAAVMGNLWLFRLPDPWPAQTASKLLQMH